MTDVRKLKELLEAFNSHDLDRIMEFFVDDCVLQMPRGPEPWGTRFVGRAAVRDGELAAVPHPVARSGPVGRPAGGEAEVDDGCGGDCG